RHRRRRDRFAAARGRGDRGRDAALEVGRQPLPDEHREPGVPARLLGVPHRLPRLLDRVPPRHRIPPERRRVRVRPGDLRPDGLPQGTRDRAADPHALLPRGVHGVVPRERRVRAAHARRARPLPARRAPLALVPPAAARRAPGSRGRALDPGHSAGAVSSGPVAGGSVLRRVAWNTAAQAVGKALVLAIGLASVVITTRYLGAAGYGKVALAFATIQMLGVLADVGLLTVVVREISRDPAQTDRLVGNALLLRLALSLVTLALAAIASLLLPWDREVRVAILIAGVPFVLGLVNSALVAVFQARLR